MALVCKIETDKIENASYLFNDSTTLLSWDSDLSACTTGYKAFSGCINLTTFTSNLEELKDGRRMFENSRLACFYSKLSNLSDGSYMFYNCLAMYNFLSNFDNLETGHAMFYGCHNLSIFYDEVADLGKKNGLQMPSLKDGSYMFKDCYVLSFENPTSNYFSDYFYSYMPNLRNGSCMFAGTGIKLLEEASDLNLLEDAREMFAGSKIKKFNKNFPNVIDTSYMFYGCNELENFNVSEQFGNNNHINADYMFAQCNKLYSVWGGGMFMKSANFMFTGCTSLTTTIKNMPYLESAESMFDGCISLTLLYDLNFSNLKDSHGMFANCPYLGTIDNMNLGSLERCEGMFENTSYLYNVSADFSMIKNGDLMFYNAGSRGFMKHYYEKANEVTLTDNNDVNGESGLLIRIRGGLNYLTNASYMFADSHLHNKDEEPIPRYMLSPFALLFDGFSLCEENAIPFEAASIDIVDNKEVSGSGGATRMFDGRLIVGTKTINRIHDIMYYNTSQSTQYFGVVALGDIDYINYFDDMFHFYLIMASLSGEFKDITGAARYSISNIVGSQMFIDLIYQENALQNSYDVSAANGYIPDASNWNDNVFVVKNLTITRVENETAFNDYE